MNRPKTCTDCQSVDRRDFVRIGGAAIAGAASTVLWNPRFAHAAPEPTSPAETAVGQLYASLSDEQKKEAEDLIAAISGLNISAATKEDMKEYKQDLADGEFDVMDLNYLRALRGRLS